MSSRPQRSSLTQPAVHQLLPSATQAPEAAREIQKAKHSCSLPTEDTRVGPVMWHAISPPLVAFDSFPCSSRRSTSWRPESPTHRARPPPSMAFFYTMGDSRGPSSIATGGRTRRRLCSPRALPAPISASRIRRQADWSFTGTQPPETCLRPHSRAWEARFPLRCRLLMERLPEATSFCA
jgi:hypothetical protein